MIRTIAVLLVSLALAAPAVAQGAPPEAAAALAPTGTLRVAINYGNPVLAQKDPGSGEPRGVSPDLARELARRLGVPATFVVFDAAGKVFEAVKRGEIDLVFLAVDPVRGAEIDFSAPYVEIEGVYLVPAASPLTTLYAVDRPGVRVAVARGSAYDLHLTRALKQATLVREPSGPEAMEMFARDKLEAAAGVKQAIDAFAAERPGFRTLPGRFMVIEQAVGTPKGRPAGLRYLKSFVEEMKASGAVAASLQRSGGADATVAPPAKGE
ncbi:ABC transporter substrate-binding protein [Rhodoplanes roseus]|uniref:ABC transporter substrate-binding protein n=1 Tax=Rhodoplanes roseus TaxID=29409 RepID=A0A327KWX9_9BRAD|nr:ABC transporter substrate-binding protein [Rhodoplanes roseus]RAI39878.1 ABC transporter substrate-binding protein [Rhodoplanes roseus]